MRYAERHTDAPRIIDAVQRAAARIITHITAHILVFVGFDGNADNVVSLLYKQCCGNGGIYTAGHTDKDALGIAFHGENIDGISKKTDNKDTIFQ
jgi:hypothetical protein